jgi:hypothetical protein
MLQRTDSELVAATLDGDRAPFGELIDRHRSRATPGVAHAGQHLATA